MGSAAAQSKTVGSRLPPDSLRSFSLWGCASRRRRAGASAACTASQRFGSCPVGAHGPASARSHGSIATEAPGLRLAGKRANREQLRL